MTARPRPDFAGFAAPLAATALLCCCGGAVALAQGDAHYQHGVEMPPGAIGREQLGRGGPLAGYWQPVEIVLPDGGAVSFEAEGRFTPPQNGSAKVAMQIGYAYRLQVTGIPGDAGEEVFPTIEIVSRLYPPPGQEWNFPIPIHLTAEELKLAMEGNVVTRVIYLEDPHQALPVQDRRDFQRYFEIAPTQEPLQTADRLGRPMAILRMGSRMPPPSPVAAPIWIPPVESFERNLPKAADPNLDLKRYPLPFAP